MSSLSQFVGGGVPFGTAITMLNAQALTSFGGQEYLKTGLLKAYSTPYASAVAAAPQLRVFGTPARTYGNTLTTGATTKIVWHDSRYWLSSNTGNIVVATTLALLSSSPTATSGLAASQINITSAGGFAVGNGYLVMRSQNANTAMAWITTGTAFNTVGGTFTTFPAPAAIAYCGALGWLALSDLSGNTGSRAYIANIVPTGTWTVDAPASVAMTVVNGIASNGTVIVAVGASGGAGFGKIATATSVSGAFTDRTAASGVTFGTAESFTRCVWTGARFVALSASRIITSTDGISWTQSDVGFETALNSPVGIATGAVSPVDLTTDGAGTVAITAGSGTGLQNPTCYVSTDHGVTWGGFQTLVATHGMTTTPGARSVSFANGKYLVNLSGTVGNFVDCEALTTPDYIGQQLNYAQGQSVRIK